MRRAPIFLSLKSTFRDGHHSGRSHCPAEGIERKPRGKIRQGADRESATTRLEGGVHSRRAGAVGHNTEREASCDQDNPNTSADLEPVMVAIVVSQL